MPTYEYRCPDGHEFELFQRMSDDPRAECPECGSESERVLSGGAGVIFKGEGFYSTDYRSEEYREKAAAEKEKKAEPGSSNGEGKGGGNANGGSTSSGEPSSSSGET